MKNTHSPVRANTSYAGINGKKIWVVRDPSSHSTYEDIFPYETTIYALAELIVGTGINAWMNENTVIYDNMQDAIIDADARWNKFCKLLNDQKAQYNKQMAESLRPFAEGAQKLDISEKDFIEAAKQAYRLES